MQHDCNEMPVAVPTGTVLFYLIRMEPFTAMNRNLQGGRFDHADRLFSNVAATWDNCLHSSSDVKELTPEFFHQSEFLLNSNNFNLGTQQVVIVRAVAQQQQLQVGHAAGSHSQGFAQQQQLQFGYAADIQDFKAVRLFTQQQSLLNGSNFNYLHSR